MTSPATSYLSSLPRVNLETNQVKSFVFLMPALCEYEFDDQTQKVKTHGLGEVDKSKKDLIEIVVVEDVIEARYIGTGVLLPRTYAESLPIIPTHVTAQAIIFTTATDQTNTQLNNLRNQYQYGLTEYDHMWIGQHSEIDVGVGEALLIMNRRVGGWDGATNRPVVELLCAGGHVPTLWDNKLRTFHSITAEDTVRREIEEEVGMTSKEYGLSRLGGFFNTVTSELVVLFGVQVSWQQVVQMQAKSFGNLEENINGLYFSPFKYAMQLYAEKASIFAGGERSKSTNFPSNKSLMQRIERALLAAEGVTLDGSTNTSS